MAVAAAGTIGRSSTLLLKTALLLPFRSEAGFLVPLGGSRITTPLPPIRMSASADCSVTDASSPPSHSPEPRKSHCTTVCAVPPASATAAWGALTRARRELRDPGFYRWPPHANILYPFLELNSMKKRNGGEDEEPLFDQKTLDSLSKAAAQCQPFEVTINEFGTFGGKGRGVLWAYPRSHAPGTTYKSEDDESEVAFCNPTEPMIQLQSYLEHEFPTCTEQRKQRRFHPHMTLSHYSSIEDASKAMEQIESWWEPITYIQSEVYVLRRVGDIGQFEIAATIHLGRGEDAIQVHDPPIRFPGMPDTEEEWVHEERMKLKARRNSSWKNRSRRRGGGRKRRTKSGNDRVPDSPEIIEAKRAARKAKREALELEALEREAVEGTDTSS